MGNDSNQNYSRWSQDDLRKAEATATQFLEDNAEQIAQTLRAKLTFLERMIERERQRGMRKHWSYDLNRHIALKQALDSLRPAVTGAAATRCTAERIARTTKRKRRPQAPLQIFG